MDDSEQKVLQKILETVEDNNEVLHGIRRKAQIATIISLIKWIIIIGSVFGLYYFIQPFLDQISGIYTSIKDNASTFQDSKESFSDAMNKFFEAFKKQ